MVVCEFTLHNNEKCENIFNEWWRVSLHHIWGLRWGKAGARNLVFSPCEVASAGDGSYLPYATGAAGVASTAIGSSSVFCNEWLFMSA